MPGRRAGRVHRPCDSSRGAAAHATARAAVTITAATDASAAAAGPSERRTVTATVTMPNGEKVQGQVLRLDNFFITLLLDDGRQRTIRREGDVPKVDVKDPLEFHKKVPAILTDKDMHDVTAYLATLK